MTNILTNRAFQVCAAVGLIVLAGFTYQNMSDEDTVSTTASNTDEVTAAEGLTPASNDQVKADAQTADAVIMKDENTDTTVNTETTETTSNE